MPTFGPYELLQRLGAGGMGEIFLARLTREDAFEKLLVIKRMLPQRCQNEAFQELFRHEARLAALLSHQNIVQIFDYGQFEQQTFIAMEYVDGIDASTLIERHGALPLGVALAIIIDAARGLDYAHRKLDPSTGEPLGLVHRDVNPRNLLLSYEGEIKWIDFGLAHAFERDGHSALIAGTMGYMSPEQAEGRSVDARSDLFGLGVTAYEMLTGALPFDSSSSPGQHAERCREGEVSPPSAHQSGIPPLVDLAVLKALAPHPQDRFDSIRGFIEALSELPRQTTATPREIAELLRTCAPPTAPKTSRPRTEVGDDPIAATRPRTEVGDDPITATRPRTEVGDDPIARSHTAVGHGLSPSGQPDPLTTSLTSPDGAPIDDQTDTSELSSITPAFPLEPIEDSPWPTQAEAFRSFTPTAPLTSLTPSIPLPPLTFPPQATRSSSPSRPPQPPAAAWRKVIWVLLGIILGVTTVTIAAVLALREEPSVAPQEEPPSHLWTLHLSSTPSKPRVLINGDARGITPLTINDLPSKTPMTLQVIAPKHQPHEATLRFNAGGGERSSHVTLDLLSGHLSFELSPSTATVALNGQPVTPREGGVSHSPGHINVSVSAPGHVPWTREVDLVSGEERRLVVALEPRPAKLKIDTQPERCEVTLSQQSGADPKIRRVVSCDAPCERGDLPAGVYTIQAHGPGRSVGQSQVELKPGELNEVVVTCEKPTPPKRSVRVSAVGMQLRQGQGRWVKSLRLSQGTFHLRAKGFERVTMRIKKGKGSTYRLSIYTKPWARLELNGERFNRLADHPISFGSHKLRLFLSGQGPSSTPTGVNLTIAR